MKYSTTVSITYCEKHLLADWRGGIDGMKKTVLDSMKNDHDMLEDTADWHICGCGIECKIIQASTKKCNTDTLKCGFIAAMGTDVIPGPE